jgi:alkanesulfonate monooxygenase SsuD/methylene tetrahydromethanopterin reductase-like flavin-dependent oxidoreductase (luciferase family)
MRLGVALPSTDGGRPLGAETLAEAAQRIEAAGFDSAWVFDSIGRGRLLPDPLTALAVAGTAPGSCRCRCAARWSWPIAS